MKAKDITKAWAEIRKTNHSIPDEVLDFMKDSAISRLNVERNEKHEWFHGLPHLESLPPFALCPCGEKIRIPSISRRAGHNALEKWIDEHYSHKN